jgi:dynactin 1
MENFKKQAEQISFLDRDIDKARKQERDFEEAIVALQAELETLETENSQLKRQLKTRDGRGMPTPGKRLTNQSSGSILDNDSNGSLNLEGADTGSNRDLLIQIDSLKSALRFLRSENSSLRTRAALQDLGLTPDASALSGPLGRVDGFKSKLIESGEDSSKRTADTELKAVALETKRLIKDARVICASPKIVDLTKHTSSAPSPTAETPRRHWQAQQTRPEWHYHTQQAALHTIQQRSNELKERLAKFSRTAVPAPSKLKKVKSRSTLFSCIIILSHGALSD